jgi:diguanylate cyclase (GGDEF)-like protein/PAS domain S-box-containing protein
MELIASEIAKAPVLGADGMSAALDRDGNVIAVHPPAAPVAVDTEDPRWAAALTGKAYAPEIVDDGERQRYYLVVPVVRADGTVEIVAVIGADVAESDWSSTQRGLGAMGSGTGGSSVVDANGRAMASWRPGAVGTVLIDPAELEGVEAGDVAVRRRVVDGEEQVTLISKVPSDAATRYTIWQQSADDLFGDLRVGQTERDAAVFALLVVAVLALAVTNRRRELALRRNAARLDALLRQAHDLVLVVGGDGIVRYASAAVEHLFDIPSTDVVGRPLADLVGDDALAVLRDESRSRYEAGDERSVTLRDLTVVGPHGHQRLFDIDGIDLRHLEEVGGYLLTFHEISERAELQARLTAQATSDPLTGLANRAQFTAHLDRLAAERRHHSGDHAVVFVDLDRFKPVNDRYGHQAGDELLRTVAQRLSAAVRATDVVCRLGGDEFAILLADCDEEQARAKVQQLLTAVREPVAIGDDTVTVDASIGVALSRSTITHPEQLVREADQAMYRAKRAGRGRIVVDA